MRKMKYVLVGALAVVLIIAISVVPIGVSVFLDRYTQGKTHLSNMDTIQLNLNGENTNLSSFQKLHLLGNGSQTMVTETQATLTRDQVQQYALESLQRFTDAGLLSGAINELYLSSCEPTIYYYPDNPELHNMFWVVQMGASSPEQVLELLVDDSTGEIYSISYFCNAQSADETATSGKPAVELLASCFLGALDIEYVVTNYHESASETWEITATCSNGEQEIDVELCISGGGFYITINP